MVQVQNERERWHDYEGALRQSESLAAAGQFAGTVIHEINNPLEAISNLAYLIQRESGDADKVRGYIGLLSEQLANVVRIAKQTLDFYRPADALVPIDLVSIAESALRVHERKIAAKRVRLIKDLTPDATVRVHPGEMLQVMSNLISNALDALPVNGALCLRVRKCGEEAHAIVADDGHGIPATILPKVFDPFFTTKKGVGTGLGLAISKAIVERHRGRIKIRSSVRSGRSGTAFRISLPLDRDTGTVRD